MSLQRQHHRILCVTSSVVHHETLHSVIDSAKYKVAYCMAVDHAVAFCMHNSVSAIVLDSAFLTGKDWSAVQTFKSICSGVPILVLANKDEEKIPPEVDAVVATPELLIQELRRVIDGRLPMSKSQPA